jgi:hypothetical protein
MHYLCIDERFGKQVGSKADQPYGYAASGIGFS